MQDFHFVTPLWLMALVPVFVLLCWLSNTGKLGQASWTARVESLVFKRLHITGNADCSRRWAVILVASVWVVGAVVLAGPAWQRVEQSAYRIHDPKIILISLAQSMNATDERPTRLVGALDKASEILNKMDGDEVGLIVYADQPIIAVPPTDDEKVINDILTQVSTDMVSVVKDRLDFAIAQAVTLLKQANASGGHILVLADDLGTQPQKAFDAATKARQAGFTVSSILVGSESGAVVRDYQGREIIDASGKPVMSKVNAAGLRRLAVVGGGNSSLLTDTNQDLDEVLTKPAAEGNGLALSDRIPVKSNR